ncbi:putative triacylglycerol lipase [Stachybotrys elegans]|uniref:Carboxylic ester hydrolase n=1 Tax=Stachybotrys elegans TaxID=80388 RepID=A0A8K0SVA9_9HYPO|nr:putative triacylglycerol lipase [Stachybotrys elegans]
MFGQRILSLALLATSVTAVQETVDLGYSRYHGQALDNGITQWYGMRYAAAPIGNLRFMPPQDPVYQDGVQEAQYGGATCLPTEHHSFEAGASEDCLFINVQAPSSATEESRLPVMLYIQGGGYSLNSSPNLNAAGLIAAASYEMMAVSFNYRVGPYGFMSDGKDIAANLGLKDQIKAMEWVREHAALFGGNPDHIVLVGVSAGAGCISLHLTAYGGVDNGLFHGAIVESPPFSTMLDVAQSKYQYTNFATRLGCYGEGTLECLRSKTAEEIQQVNFNIPLPGGAKPPEWQWLPVIDGDLITDYTYRAFDRGNFIRVPAIFGADANDGTKFVPSTLSSLAESNQWLLNQYPTLTLDQFADIASMYPNPNESCPATGCYWRQASNVYGEMRFLCPAIFMNTAMSAHGVMTSYSYMWNVSDPAQMEAGEGVPHIIEVDAWLGPGYSNPPESYKPGQMNAEASPVIQGYWTSFIRYLDPNPYRRAGSAEWSPWSEDKAWLVFGVEGRTDMEFIGDELERRCNYWADNAVALTI